MTGNGEAPATPAEVRRPTILIRFGGVSSAEIEIIPDKDVTVAQLYVAAWLLDAYAHETRAGQAAMAAGKQLSIAPADLLSQLGLGRPQG